MKPLRAKIAADGRIACFAAGRVAGRHEDGGALAARGRAVRNIEQGSDEKLGWLSKITLRMRNPLACVSPSDFGVERRALRAERR